MRLNSDFLESLQSYLKQKRQHAHRVIHRFRVTYEIEKGPKGLQAANVNAA